VTLKWTLATPHILTSLRTNPWHSKEQLTKIIESADEVISACDGTNEDVHHESDDMLRLWDYLNDVAAPPQVVKRLAEIALAALESRADADQHIRREVNVGGNTWVQCSNAAFEKAKSEGKHVRELYERPQPAPVVQCVPIGDSPYDVPRSMPSNLRELIAEEIGILFSDDDAQSVWEVCRRAAMLQGKGEQPYSTQQTGWTGNGDADAALVMLGRIDTLDSADDARIEDIKRIIRTLAEPVRQPYTLPECFDRLFKHAQGLTFGDDWNRGTAAKYHRDLLIKAVDDCRAMLAAALQQDANNGN